MPLTKQVLVLDTMQIHNSTMGKVKAGKFFCLCGTLRPSSPERLSQQGLLVLHSTSNDVTGKNSRWSLRVRIL
ncbi:hypothetical protein E6H21_07865 [Candidatus Bathyarchaeota archaeon]|nr:MAG: hypothetical protein E6H21_07865 [Candidatus Bathyarchaeota archaeon]